MAARDRDAVFVVPAQLAEELIREQLAEPHDLYRGVDIPVEVILTGISLGADTVTLISARSMLAALCAQVAGWLAGKPAPDETKLTLRRGATEVSLEVSGSADTEALLNAITALLDSA